MTPVGAAVSVAALGVKDGIACVVTNAGKQARGASSGGDHGYKFGYLTRGVVCSIRARDKDGGRSLARSKEEEGHQ